MFYRVKLKTIFSSRVDQMNSLLARLRDSPAIKNAPQYLQITHEEDAANPLPSLLLDSIFVDFFKSTYGKKKTNKKTSVLRPPPFFFRKCPKDIEKETCGF